MLLRFAFGIGAILASGCVVTSPPPDQTAADPAPARSAGAEGDRAPPEGAEREGRARDRNEAERPRRSPAEARPRPERDQEGERPRRAPPRPEPDPAPDRAPPRGQERCDRGAELLYAETTREIEGERTRRLAVLESGAVSLYEDGQTRSGCLSEDDLRDLRVELGETDFEPPPPPEVICQAMPSERITYEDRARGRRAVRERPCGSVPLNPSVDELSGRVSEMVASALEAPPRDRPARCEERGEHLVSVSVSAAEREGARRASGDDKTTRVRVARDGSWIRSERGDVSCGELSRRELRRLRAEVRRAEIGTSEPEVRCRALPTREYRLRGLGERASWQAPCGRRAPTEDAERLAEAVLAVGA